MNEPLIHPVHAPLAVRRRALSTWIIFALLSCAVIVGMSYDYRPKPLYPICAEDQEFTRQSLSFDLPLLFSIENPERIPVGFWIKAEVATDHGGIKGWAFPVFKKGNRFGDFSSIQIEDDQRDGDWRYVALWKDPSFGEPVRSLRLWIHGIDLRIAASQYPPGKDAITANFWGDPRHEVEARGQWPLIILEYLWWSRLAIFAWVLPLGVLLWAARSQNRREPFLVVLCLVCVTASLLVWQAHYTHHVGHLDADGYGRCAEKLAAYLTTPKHRPAIAAWLHDYPHTHTALAPAVMAPFIALGLPMQLVYLQFSTLCTFGAVLLIVRILQTRLGLSPGATLLGVICFACHLLVLRTFSRPITDALGLFLTVAMLDSLLARARALTRGNTIALIAIALLLPLARPQGFAYWPFMLAGVLAIDRARDGEWKPAATVRNSLLIFLPPVLVLAALYLAFDWQHNVRLMFEKAEQFRVASTPRLFGYCVFSLLSILPPLWLPLLARGRARSFGLRLLVAWLAYYLLMLAVVRAPFWPRHFVPCIPAVIALAAAGFDTLRPSSRRIGIAVAAGFCLLNVGATILQTMAWDRIPERLMLIISSG